MDSALWDRCVVRKGVRVYQRRLHDLVSVITAVAPIRHVAAPDTLLLQHDIAYSSISIYTPTISAMGV